MIDDAPDGPVSFGFEEVARGDKATRVRGVFDRVARRYDLMNDVLSLGVHRVWKDFVIARANPQPGERLLDVAGGTGDLARRWVARGGRAAARRGGPPPDAVVCDINEQMLRAGRGGRGDGITWTAGDAERLPFKDKIADAVTIGFGIRNVTDRAAALAEMRRVLKPGGRFLCLEFSRLTTATFEPLYDAWSFKAIPRLGGLLAKDEASYRYLAESIRRFPDQEAFAAEVRAAGFKNVTVANYSGGVAALHMGWRI